MAVGQRCQPLMGSVGDARGNALWGSFLASLECEILDRYGFKSQTEARLAVFRYVEGWHNPHRRRSALDYQSLVNYEGCIWLRVDLRSRAGSSERDQLHHRNRRRP